MKKIAATILMTGILAVAGFTAPANAAPESDIAVSTPVKAPVNHTSIGWWPH